MAKVVREKLGRPVQLIKDIVRSAVEATCADPAPGSAILLENSHLYAEEEGTGKDTDDNKIRADPEKVKDSAIPLPRWLTSTAVMPSAHAVHPLHACCYLVQLGMHGRNLLLA